MTVRGIGAVLTLPELTREQLLEYLADNPDVAPAIARELARRLEQLEQLADYVIHPLVRAEEIAGRKLARLENPTPGSRPKYPATHARQLDDARDELADVRTALELARQHAPTRRRILEALAGS